jgi:hypothetical protein
MRHERQPERRGPHWIEQVNAERIIQRENARIGVAIR